MIADIWADVSYAPTPHADDLWATNHSSCRLARRLPGLAGLQGTLWLASTRTNPRRAASLPKETFGIRRGVHLQRRGHHSLRKGETRPARRYSSQPTARPLRSGVSGGAPSGEGTTNDDPSPRMAERCREAWQHASPENVDGGGPPKRVAGLRRGVPRGGTSLNRRCACCSSAMEQNGAGDPVVAVEYCHRCDLEPLCAACSNYEFGLPEPRDMRWARLTLAAANAFPRTVDGIERPLQATCCRCLGVLGQEHISPEQPLPISCGRPEGWTACDQCRFNLVRLKGGRFFWRHSCTRDTSQHS